MKVSVAEAKNKLTQIVTTVVVDNVPAGEHEPVAPRFGTMKGKIKI